MSGVCALSRVVMRALLSTWLRQMPCRAVAYAVARACYIADVFSASYAMPLRCLFADFHAFAAALRDIAADTPRHATMPFDFLRRLIIAAASFERRHFADATFSRQDA